MSKNCKMIFSDANDCMIHSGFTYRGYHFTWNEPDELYYRDDVDDCSIGIEESEQLSKVCMPMHFIWD